MDFLKKNYEKVLLGVVLLGLAVAAGFLPFKISSEKTKLRELTDSLTSPKVTPLTNLDLTVPQTSTRRAGTPANLDFSAPNRVFSPMPWQKGADGRLSQLDEANIGPRAVAILKLTPLYLTLSLDSVQMIDSGPRYLIGIERENAPTQRERTKRQTAVTAESQNDIFSVRQVQGPAENPTNIVVELSDGVTVNLPKAQSFKRVDGYMADLKYDPERKTWRNQRVGDKISFSGEEYNIVAINEGEVVISAKSNQKKWTIRYSPSATPEPAR
jgi:hypothetical protein